jgi:hypothetical protein
MDVEQKITKIEVISVRIRVLALLILGLVAVFLYSLFELTKFVSHQLVS